MKGGLNYQFIIKGVNDFVSVVLSLSYPHYVIMFF